MVKKVTGLPKSEDVDSEWPKEGRDYTTVNDKWYWSHEKVPFKEIKSEGGRRLTERRRQAKEEETRDGKFKGGELDSFRMMYEAFKKEMAAAKDAEEKARIQSRFQEQTQNVDEETKREVYKSMDRQPKKIRLREVDGGSMLVPPEMEEMPVDTYTPEEQANAADSQLPDSEMEDNYMDYVLGESLESEEQDYLMNALESDPKLSEIFDKVIMTASEFTGAGEVEGPGTGVSDSIPARLSDGEFVITKKATDQIGADNLQNMMDDAERMADGGEARYGYQIGGMLSKPYANENLDEQKLKEDPMKMTEDEINKSMMQANRIPSLMGTYR